MWPTVDPFEELAETVAPVGAFTLLGAEKGCMFLKESTRAFNVAARSCFTNADNAALIVAF